jgi:hypothetical protein
MMKHLTRKVAVACGGAALVLVLTAAAASAGPTVKLVSSSNGPGTIVIGTTSCVTDHAPDPFIGMTNVLTITANFPSVYARNLTTAVDRQYVTARTKLVDLTLNKIVQTSNWAPWTIAADNAPANFGLSTRYTAANVSGWDVSHVYATQQEIWWYNANGTYSSVVYQLTSYNQGVFYYGTLYSSSVQPTCHASA